MTICRPSYAITNVTAVLPDRLLDDATIVVEDGVIVDVGSGVAVPAGAIDGRGTYCSPGLVDSHSDGLEKELRPRPAVVLPVDFALRSFEARVRSAGVTTVFHGVAYENSEKYTRTVEQATWLEVAIAERRRSPGVPVDHRVLHRLDVRDAAGLDALHAHLRQRQHDPEDVVPLVSAEDHTPGVGQYLDRSNYERYVAGTKGLDDAAAKRYIDDVLVDRESRSGQIEHAVSWLTEHAAAGLIRSMAHDPVTADDIDVAVDRSVAIAEFPTTLEAAQRARSRGLRTVAGAPNVVRGGSHSGNVGAADLVAARCCDGLASDYLPSALLGAVGVLVDDGVCDLPSAIALVTSGPADTVGLSDRGRIEAGRRADLVLFELDGRLPSVRLVLGADDLVAPVGSDQLVSATRLASEGVLS